MNQTQKHTTGKKLLALLLALIMSVSLLPMSVFAADLGTEAPIVEGQTQQDVQQDAALDESSGEEKIVDSQEPVAEDPAPVEEPTEDDVDTLAAEGDVAVQADAFTVDETTALTRSKVGDVNYRAVMLDCGRKYFSVANIEKLIDTIAQYGYNQLQLSFGNGGCRFLLDDMSLSFKGVTMSSDTVKANITNGNYNFNGDKRCLTETDMDAIIAYANNKGIEIVPMLNMPGHATAIVYDTSYSNNGNLNVTDETARYYGYALLNKYVQYFKTAGCKYFSFGSDESGYTGTNMTAFLTGCANVIVGAGMTPRAFNDATNVATMPTSVQITYWHQESGSKTASALANAGYEMINTHGRWYYVIKTAQNSEIGTKYWQGTVNQTATSVELPVMKAEKMDKKWVGLNEYFDGNPGYGSTVSGSKGTMFCIWCDASQDAYLKDSDVISENENYGALYQLEKLAEHYWPDDIKKTTAPVVTTESGAAVPTTMTANGTVTLKASESVTWTTSNANVIKLESVSGTRSASVTGASVKATAVGTGKSTITATNASNETVSYTINVQDAAAATTKNVTLKVGETATFNVDASVTAGNQVTDNEYIATAKVERVEAVAGTTVSTTKATTLEDGASYIMRVYDTNYALTSNTGRTAWNTRTLAFETYTAAEDDNVWTLEKSGNGYKIKCAAGYLNLGTGNNTAYVANSGEVFTLTSTPAGWTVMNPSREYINALGGLENYYSAGGWTGDSTRFDFYKVTTATEASNTLTITGTGEGKTSVTVGTVTYNITVTAPETTETKALSYGSSFTLPTGATAKITSGSGVTIEDGKVVAGSANATAVVTAVVTNAGGKVTARYTYNITVTEIDFDNVQDLPVELWITNTTVGADTAGFVTTSETRTNGNNSATVLTVKVSAQSAYAEEGVLLSSLVPVKGYKSDNDKVETVYWKGTVQTTQPLPKGDDLSNAGTDFTRIRYWNNAWEYQDGSEWKAISSTNTVVAYYLQINNVSPEITTGTQHYGNPPTSNPGSSGNGFTLTAFAVVYPDGTLSRTEQQMYETGMIRGYYGSTSFELGAIFAANNSTYRVSKMTVTWGENVTGTSSSATWNSMSGTYGEDWGVNWDKTTNSAGDEWYKEKTYWENGDSEIPTINDSTLKFTYGQKNAVLILIYLEVVETENTLNIIYWDDNGNKQITTNPMPIPVVVAPNVTFIPMGENGIQQVSAVTAGTFTLDDDAYIKNSSGAKQGFNKNLSTVPGVPGVYLSGLYQYVSAEISGDGMTLTLHFNVKDTSDTKKFVVDFGLPITIKASDFGIYNTSGIEWISLVAGDSAVTEKQGNYGYAKINTTDWSYVTYTLNETLDGTATIPLYVKFEGETETRLFKADIIPASTVYYEDSFAKFYNSKGEEQTSFTETGANDTMGTWYWDGAETNASPTQALEELGKKQNVYGYDPAYNTNSTTFSMGSAKKVTVDASVTKAPTATFTFKGTGFDIISLTDNNSGAILVNVERKDATTEDEKYNKNFMVNNYYGYDYDEATGEWTVNTGKNNTLYQIPVMKVTDLPYGQYTVTIKVSYGSFFDKTGNSQYSFWLDAIRVYDPMGKDYADYTKDQEGYPQYIKLRDALAKDAATVNENLLFIDGAKKAEVSLYKNYGPNNEVYLASGQAISFKLTGDLDKIATIQVGAKKPDGSAAVMIVNNENVSIANSATEMYYTITRDNNNCVTITNTGADILSLTNLKVTFTSAGAVSLTKTSTQEQANAVAAVRALFTAPEPDPEPVVFAPEYFQATWNRSTVKVGQKATLTVKTSADVETVTVNGQDIGNYRVRTERTGWGWNAKKVTYHVFTFTVTATEAGTLDYSVVAANAEGVNSEAITATLTVQAAAQRPGFGGWLDKIFSRWF